MRPRDRSFQRNPSVAESRFGKDVGKLARAKSHRNESRRVAPCFENRADRDRLIIAIADPEFDSASETLQRFDAVNIAHETNIFADPIPNGVNFATEVAPGTAARNFDKKITGQHIGIAHGAPHEIPHKFKRCPCPLRSRRDRL